jgi:hypothetical protein
MKPMKAAKASNLLNGNLKCNGNVNISVTMACRKLENEMATMSIGVNEEKRPKIIMYHGNGGGEIISNLW